MSFSSGDRKRLFDKLSSCRPSRRAGVKALADFASAHPRPRTSGVVGPELDLSFIYAQIQNDEFGRRGHFPTYKLLRELIQPHSLETRRANDPGYMVADHAKLETCFMSLDGIRQWTRFANKFGVRFNGARGYIFPKKSVWNTSVDCFNYIVATGRSKTHKRSPEARLRRSERRRMNAQVPKGPFPEVYLSEPIVDRYIVPARVQRIMYDPSTEKWQAFKARYGAKAPSVNVRHARGPIPDIVRDAITKIYSVTVKVARVSDDTITKAKQAITPVLREKLGNLSIPKANARARRVRELQELLSELTDTLEVATSIRWYNANREFTRLSRELEELTSG